MASGDDRHCWYRRHLLGASGLSMAGLSGCVGTSDSGTPAAEVTPPPTDTETPDPKTPREGDPVDVPDHLLDVVDFGNATSEDNHDFEHQHKNVQEGTFGQYTRVLEPRDARLGGSASFTVACDPTERTYLTVKFWGGDGIRAPLLLFDGQELISSTSSADGWPSLEGGIHEENLLNAPYFRYSTYRLPTYLTEESEDVRLRVMPWENDTETRGLYRAYTHTEAQFDPPAAEEQADSPATPPIKPESGKPIQYVVDQIGPLVEQGQQEETVGSKAAMGLAMARDRDWIDTLDRDAAFETIRNSIDQKAIEQANSAPSDLFRRGWVNHGEFARAFLLAEETFRDRDSLATHLEGHPDAPISRKEAYSQFFRNALEWRAQDRRVAVTNQILYVTRALVRMSQALGTIAPERAPAQEVVDRWIDEAVGIEPVTPTRWPSDSIEEDFEEDDINNTAGVNPNALSGVWHLLTEKGSTKEPRWAQGYGEQVHQLTALYEETGAERVKERAIDLERARVAFRDVYTKADGSRTLGTEGVIASRKNAYPAMVGSLNPYSNWPLYQAKVLNIPESQRLADLAIDHGRAGTIRRGRFGVGGLSIWIPRVEGYRATQQREKTSYRLPFERSETTAWADEDIGVVAVHDGDVRLHVTLGYNASSGPHDWGVNELARVHYRTPAVDRLALIDMDATFPTTGATWTRTNNLMWSYAFFGNDVEQPLDLPEGETTVDRAVAGQKVPQTCHPNGDTWPGASDWEGREFDHPSNHVGMAMQFGQCRYGDYLIGMNATGAPDRGFGEGQTFELDVPEEAPAMARDLVSGERVDLTSPVAVGPRSTRVLDLSGDT